ncbi:MULTISPECIES: transposase [unclassified Variovorax]|uniref:transposase n=1 Tax=unclassified Variovorax TaxID=663243 RepID=UPI0032E7AA5C
MRDGNVSKRQYTDEFKIEAIRLCDSVGDHEAARRLGKRRPVDLPPVPETNSAQPLRRPVAELEAENSRLRKGLADAKPDVEVLRKATVNGVSDRDVRTGSAEHRSNWDCHFGFNLIRLMPRSTRRLK